MSDLGFGQVQSRVRFGRERGGSGHGRFLLSKPIFQKDVAFMPFQQVDRPNGKDIIKDYTSEDGNTKYHAEFHYNTGKFTLSIRVLIGIHSLY